MPDKKREEFFINLFLEWYNLNTNKHYTIITRPDEENREKRTYDFLCKDTNSITDFLAVEEKSLNKSTENVRDNIETAEIVSEVNKILNQKGLFYNQEHHFYLEFRNAPKSKERIKYASKIAALVETVISMNKDTNIGKRHRLKTDGCDLVKEFSLLETRKTPRVFFSYAPESNVSWDVQSDAFNATLEIVQNSNIQLEAPRQEGKRTILIITNKFIIVNSDNVEEAIRCIEKDYHKNIDEIYFINKNSFEHGYAIDQVK